MHYGVFAMRAPLKAGLTALGILALPLSAQADIIGFEAGVSYWQQNPSGWIEDEVGGTPADIEDDLSLDDESDFTFWAAFEHPIPLLPNIKLRHTPMDLSGSGNVSREFTFRGETYSANADVDSSLQLDQTDFILYYELLDNWVSLDLGANIKYIDGELNVTGTSAGATASETLSFSAPIPMLYGRALAALPFTGLSVGAEASGIAYSGNNLVDASAFLRYEVMVLGVEAGYRYQQLELDDVDDVSADIEISGPYLGLYADF